MIYLFKDLGVMNLIIMSVDLGKARTGLAICDKSELLAHPLEVIEERYIENLLIKVSEKAKENGAQMIVVGLPKNMDGSEGESAQNAREFTRRLAEISSLPVDNIDERGTTITAHNFLNTTNTRGKKRKAVVDAVAATIILEDYLNTRKNKNTD